MEEQNIGQTGVKGRKINKGAGGDENSRQRREREVGRRSGGRRRTGVVA
jgi:hypothetical protein